MKLRRPTLNECAYGLLAVMAIQTAMLIVKLDQSRGLSSLLTDELIANQIEAASVAAEEHALGLPAHWFVNRDDPQSEAQEGISLVVLVDPNNCSNGLESDIARLNYFHRHRPGWINSVEGYYVSEQYDLFEEFRSMHDIQFPLSKRSIPLPYMDNMTTPLVLIIDSQSGMVLDTHQPIPDDLQKSQLFYDKWTRLMNRYTPS